jgi:hypothetical protein
MKRDERNVIAYILMRYLTLAESGEAVPVLQSGNDDADDLALAIMAVIAPDDERFANIQEEADTLGLEMDDDLYNALANAGVIDDYDLADNEVEGRILAEEREEEMAPRERNSVSGATHMDA